MLLISFNPIEPSDLSPRTLRRELATSSSRGATIRLNRSPSSSVVTDGRIMGDVTAFSALLAFSLACAGGAFTMQVLDAAWVRSHQWLASVLWWAAVGFGVCATLASNWVRSLYRRQTLPDGNAGKIHQETHGDSAQTFAAVQGGTINYYVSSRQAEQARPSSARQPCFNLIGLGHPRSLYASRYHREGILEPTTPEQVQESCPAVTLKFQNMPKLVASRPGL